MRTPSSSRSSAVAAPCKLLDDTIGPDAQHALRRGRAGAVCRVLAGGEIAVGSTVVMSAPPPRPTTGAGVSPAHGLLLAAGAGRRMGRPKALVDDWLVASLAALRDGAARR